MSTGLLALLDDIAALAKMAAVTLDDVATLTVQAGTESVGVVADDAAVTPRYVIGFKPERELPIIRKIAIGSLKNKLVILLPAALLCGWLMPWIITPVLMLGACYLCFEGYEKLHDYFHPAQREKTLPEAVEEKLPNVQEMENERVESAIRTDFILSAEIMAIAFASVKDQPLLMQGFILLAVAFGITALVYGVVALIVKADDAGLYLAQRKGKGEKIWQAIGRGLVRSMAPFLQGLSALGTVAMLYVSGGILVHGFAGYGAHFLERLIHIIPYGSPVLTVILAAAAGFLVALAVPFLQTLWGKAAKIITKKS
ncbi:MAG: DUF808 domain-containing protein [Pseudomonadota bacterium]|nr:DUF808 domain-containing protein [Pseudomonadota bacterium]QKK04668.1 MAG: DUF808 domain-containing protein [Pseudomonadota bacterium]